MIEVALLYLMEDFFRALHVPTIYQHWALKQKL
jgi:hypothetical protein